MSKATSSARATGNNSVDMELKRLWDKVNELSRKLDNISTGARKLEEGSGFRLVDNGDKQYLEAKFRNGWARLDANFNTITKKD